MKAHRSQSSSYQVPENRPRDRLVVATTVRMARAALGWSQVELGRRLGMTQRSVHRIEQGHSEPRLTTLLAIEHLLRRAGLQIEHRADGGVCIVVPASLLRDREPADVAAPSLSDCNLVPDEQEDAEICASSHPALNPSISG
jgi:transcriptional regulator with XRE-family HTH domain